MIYLMLLLNICMLVTGQVLWKLAVSNIVEWNSSTIFSLLVSPYFLGGAFLYALATGVWLYVLSKLPLSVAYPSQSLSYVFAAFIALLLFKETIGTSQWIGMVLIIVGVYFIAK